MPPLAWAFTELRPEPMSKSANNEPYTALSSRVLESLRASVQHPQPPPGVPRTVSGGIAHTRLLWRWRGAAPDPPSGIDTADRDIIVCRAMRHEGRVIYASSEDPPITSVTSSLCD